MSNDQVPLPGEASFRPGCWRNRSPRPSTTTPGQTAGQILRIARHWLGLSLAIAAIQTTQATVQRLAGPVANPANGHWYYLLSTASWPESEAFAQSLGGHLATINDGAENQWVLDTFRDPSGLTPIALWLGLNDAAMEGTWVWASGEGADYQNWAPGEPNNTPQADPTGEDFASIRPRGEIPDGSWNDLPTDGGGDASRIFGVVEVVPESRPWGVAPLLLVAGWAICRPFRRLAGKRHPVRPRGKSGTHRSSSLQY